MSIIGLSSLFIKVSIIPPPEDWLVLPPAGVVVVDVEGVPLEVDCVAPLGTGLFLYFSKNSSA